MARRKRSYADKIVHEMIEQQVFHNNRFKRLLLCMFKWDNLPDGISGRFIEETLYYNGLVIFFKSKKGQTKGSYICSKATIQGLNLYNEPTSYLAFSDNGIVSEVVQPEECVAIWNDYNRQPNVYNVNTFSKRLDEIDNTISCNLIQLKHPVIISCSENQKTTMEIFFKKVNSGEPLVVVDEAFNSGGISAFDLKAQNHIEQLYKTRRDIYNEALTFFGINNVNVYKKERLITSEAEQNDQEININKSVMYYPRLDAVREINRKFNLDVKLSLDMESIKDLVSL